MAILPKTHVKPISIQILLFGIIALILVDVLTKFNILNLSSQTANIFTVIYSLFLLSEVSVMQLLKKGKMNGISLFIAVIAALALIGVVLSLLGVTPVWLITIQGVVGIALILAVVVEIFR